MKKKSKYNLTENQKKSLKGVNNKIKISLKKSFHRLNKFKIRIRYYEKEI